MFSRSWPVKPVENSSVARLSPKTWRTKLPENSSCPAGTGVCVVNTHWRRMAAMSWVEGKRFSCLASRRSTSRSASRAECPSFM